MVDKKYLSPSQLGMLARCGLQYEFRYIQGIKAPPGVAMLVGTATHRAIEKNLKAKMQTGDLLPVEQVADAAADAMRGAWAAEGPALSDEEREQGAAAVKGEATDTAVKLVSLHATDLAPKIKPVHVEREVYVTVNGFPYDLKGYMDIQEPDGVRDTKTAGKAPAADVAEKSIQGAFYSLARTAIDGLPPAKFSMDYLVKTKTPKATTLEYQVTEEDHSRLLRRVEKAAKIIGAGAFGPPPEDSWVCSSRFCGYWDRCAFGARQRVQG